MSSDTPSHGFPPCGIGRVLVVGGMPASGLLPLPVPARHLPLDGVAPGARVSVRVLMDLGRKVRQGNERLLILTDRDLFLAECSSLFGFADSRADSVIVSTFFLKQNCNADQLRRRVGNTIAHEIGHLEGIKHCRKTDCLMHPAESAAALDLRGFEFCGHCPVKLSRRFGRRIARLPEP